MKKRNHRWCDEFEQAIALARARSIQEVASVLVAARQVGRLFIVEGEIDALSLMSVGIAAVGVPGAAAFDPAWVKQWEGIPKLVVVGDGDHAGHRFVRSVTRTHSEVLGEKPARRKLTAGQWPETQDANDLLLAGVLRTAARGFCHE